MAHNISSSMIVLQSKDYNILQEFFRGETSQVSVIDVISGQPIHFKKAINKYIIKVEPHRAVLEPDYFIKLIENAEQLRTEEIEKVESGALDSEEEAAER